MSVIITLKLLSLVSKIPHACLIASLSAAYIYDSTPTITKNEGNNKESNHIGVKIMMKAMHLLQHACLHMS